MKFEDFLNRIDEEKYKKYSDLCLDYLKKNGYRDFNILIKDFGVTKRLNHGDVEYTMVLSNEDFLMSFVFSIETPGRVYDLNAIEVDSSGKEVEERKRH